MGPEREALAGYVVQWGDSGRILYLLWHRILFL